MYAGSDRTFEVAWQALVTYDLDNKIIEAELNLSAPKELRHLAVEVSTGQIYDVGHGFPLKILLRSK